MSVGTASPAFEQFYLKNNPDVAEAVAAGDFSASNFSRFQKLP